MKNYLYRFRVPPSLAVHLQELFVHGLRSAIRRAGKPGMTRGGQSLIEILIAISAITIVLVSLVSAATQSLSGSVSARTQALATKLAEDQMEKIRAYRDRNGLTGITCADKCYLNDSLALQSSQATVDILSVWFTVTVPGNCPAGNRQATAISQWLDGKGTHQAKLISCFSLWQ